MMIKIQAARSLSLGFPIQSLSCLLMILLLLTGLPAQSEAYNNDLQTTHVLILSSYHRGYTWTEDIIEGIMDIFSNYYNPVEFSFEYLDTKRHEETLHYYELIAEVFEHKYHRRPVDILILSDNSAFDFVAAYRQRLFPETPVVFCGINNYTPAMRELIPQSSGVAEFKEMDATLDVMLRLHPGIRRIAIISDDTGTGMIDAELAKEAARKHPELELIELSGADLTLSELLSQLRQLPPDTGILFSSFWRDRNETAYAVEDILPRITQSSKSPVYTHADTFLIGGVVGGVLAHGRIQGQLAGDIAVRILQGTSPDSIPVASHSNIPVFDYTALERWRIDRNLLPANSMIINPPPPSLYERHTALVWTVILVFLALVTLIIVLVTNIINRLRTENALRRSEERFRSLIELSPFPIIVGNDGRCLYANQAFAKLVGSPSPETLIGRKVLDFIAPEEQDKVGEYIAGRTPDRAIPSSYESVGVRLDGSRFPFASSVADIELPDGPCSLSFVQDITERIQAEQEKEHLHAQLLHAQKMESVGRLAGGVAHDFNNMLSVILGQAELALEKVDPIQPLYNDLLEIRKAAERSAEITRQLLGFARKQTVAPKVLDLNETVEGMLNMLRRLIGEDIDLAWVPGKDLEPVKIDPSQIDQILANLCINARAAIADVGKITIETGTAVFNEAYCARHAGFIPGRYILLSVSDNGCGMDKETLAHIFEPFFTTRKFGEGTGLGLATVYGIVRQNNGFINVYSEPGHGTRFSIYLPRHRGEIEQPRPSPVPIEPTTPGGETILLVEDEPTNLKMTASMLKHLGYTVLSASSPGEAIRLVVSNPTQIDLLLTDVVMPEMNGHDLAQNLLTLRPNLKQLFMSGYTANVIARHGVLDPGVHFIQKPFTIKELAARVREALL